MRLGNGLNGRMGACGVACYRSTEEHENLECECMIEAMHARKGRRLLAGGFERETMSVFRKMRPMSTVVGAVCALALALGALTGCMDPSTSANSTQDANRAYMEQVNQKMTDLEEGLSTFTDAVSRGDVVSMRTLADKAYSALDALEELEVPEGLEDIHSKYSQGADQLKSALDAYIALFADVKSAQSGTGASFDWSTYADRVSSIQDAYDQGIQSLKNADEAAAAKE